MYVLITRHILHSISHILSGSVIFFVVNGMIDKNVFDKKCPCLTFYITFMWNYSPFKEFSTRYYCKHTSILTQSTQYFCPIFAKIKLSLWILIRVPSTKSHKNLSCGSWAAACRWTDMVKLIIPFCDVAQA